MGEKGYRRVAGGIRAGGVQPCDHRQRRPCRSGVQRRRCQRVHGALAANTGAERSRAEHRRSADGRDSRRRCADVPQHHVVAAQLVLLTGRTSRSARTGTAIPRYLDGAPDSVCGGARSWPHAGFSAQHEGEFDVSARQRAQRGIRASHGALTVDHGLRALQLHRAT